MVWRELPSDVIIEAGSASQAGQMHVRTGLEATDVVPEEHGPALRHAELSWVAIEVVVVDCNGEKGL